MDIRSLTRALPAAVLLLVAPLQSARADWQFTRWGMTVEDAISAADKKSIPLERFSTLETDKKGNTPRLLVKRQRLFGGDFSVTLYFGPRNNTLIKVTLCTADPSSFGDYERRQILEELERAFGRPSRLDHLREMTVGVWADRERNNAITATLPLPDPDTLVAPVGCLTYEPLVAARVPTDF